MKASLERVLAHRIRAVANARDMPLSHLADATGLARSYLWRLLAGESSATLASVQRMAETLEVEPLALLDATAPLPEATAKQKRKATPRRAAPSADAPSSTARARRRSRSAKSTQA